ncbi:MAG TPA: polysaccharide deacetylase family protein [Chlamydiales bacterium]|nr:polysaccharide deacetylase family protein [Chlamydiales bacterium]
MKLLFICMFHQIGEGKYANHFETFKKQIEYFERIGHFTLPGKPLAKGYNFCLTFDDATYDFYEIIYPFLKEKKISALLAVPIDLIENPPNEQRKYCNFEELEEMVQSPYVEIASHSMSHINLLKAENLEYEIVHSKKVLEEKLKTTITSFVYPYGKMNRNIQKIVEKEYLYAFRIGTSINFSWTSLLYRIPCDNLQSIDKTTSLKKVFLYIFNFFKNKVRGR